MPLQKLQFRPGVNREGTTLANEGGWFESDKVRFRSGYPEKIGGWILDTGVSTETLQPPSGSFWGICRSMWNWLNLSAYNLLALGTNLKYYIQNGVDGNLYDITPLRNPSGTAVASNAFTTTVYTAPPSAYVTVVCNVAGHGAQTGDFVTISGVASAVNGIPSASLNAEFQVTYISSNEFSIQVFVTASVTAGTTGAGTFTFQITTGNEIFTQNVGWGAGPWSGIVLGATTTAVSGGTLSNSNTTVTVTSTTGFTPSGYILIDSETIYYGAGGGGGTTFTSCVRGVSGSPGSGAATTHANGAAVTQATLFTGWGSPANSGIGSQLRLWSESNFGEDLVFNPRGGALYYWANSATANTFNRGQVLGPSASIALKSGTVSVDAYCPSVANIVMVSDSSRFVIAFGANDAVAGSTIQNPMFICWSDQEDITTWFPAVTNQAGSFTLSNGSQIVATVQTRQEILVITDAAIYSMQYLGPPYVWGFQLMGDNISIMGPNAAATANNVTYWMGTDKFYMYSGRVETLPCSLRQYVYNDINLSQQYQFFASTSEGYNEIWWFYCSVSGPTGTNTPSNPNTTIDRYVVFNHLERTWYYGTMPRTFWLDSPLRPTPMSTGYDGKLIYQENGNDDGATTPGTLLPIEAYVQSSDFDIGDGHNFGLVTRIIPDVTFDGSTSAAPSLDFAVRPRQFPGTNYGTANAPTVTSGDNYTNDRYYPVQQFTEQVFVRIRGRQMALKVISNDLGVAWQLGVPRIDTRPDGRR